MNSIENQQLQASPVSGAGDHWHQGLSATQKRALSFLGQGVAPVMVASTLGVSESLISQMLAEPRFAEEVTRLKLAALQKQTGIDNKYLEAEDKLIDKFLKTIPLITKPRDILDGIRTINATKRRGAADAGSNTAQSQVVQITLPGVFAAQFVTNGQNQIVEINHDSGTRSLVTATPSALDKLAAEVVRRAEETPGVSWDEKPCSDFLIEQASKRLEESAVAETIPKGLRRSFETKGEVAADDL